MAATVILNCWICKILLADGVRRGNTHHCTKFRQNRFFVVEILQFFKFSKCPSPPSWIFEIVKFYWLLGSRGSRRIFMPNFVRIGQSVAKILRFFDFSSWWLPASWIFKFVKFYWLTVSGGPRRITLPNFIKTGPSVAEILRLFEFSRWPPPPSWIFKIAKFYWLLGSRGSRQVKIGQSVAKILRFFDFSRWRPFDILDSFGAYLDHPQWVLVGHCHSAKFGYDQCSSFYNMNISIFGWKMPIHAPKIVVFGQFDPQNGVQYQRKPKKVHPCVSPRHLSH